MSSSPTSRPVTPSAVRRRLFAEAGTAALGAFALMAGAPEAGAAELSAFGACPAELASQAPAMARCATLTVPEDSAKPRGRHIRLPLLKLPSSSGSPGTPLFVLNGGPGEPNLSSLRPVGDVLKDRDVYYLGYRGADGSEVLDCPEIDDLVTAPRLLAPASLQALGRASGACAERLRAAGYDLSRYGMLDVIADLEVARSALGLQKIDLLSISYGTRVAQLYARRHPGRIERSVMAGANPPGHFVFSAYVNDKVLRRLAELCGSDPACAAKSPDLRRTILDAISLGERGKSATIDDGKSRLALFFALYGRAGTLAFVEAARAAEAGDTGALEALGVGTAASLKHIVGGDLMSKGAVDAYRYADMERTFPSTAESMGSPLDVFYQAVAEAWPKTTLPEDLGRAGFDEAETLVINGDLDVSTPLLFIESDLMPRLRRGQLVTLKDYGHSDFGRLGPVLGRMIAEYLRTGRVDRTALPVDPYTFP